MFPLEGRFLEFMLAGIVALVVVGPKDLPILLRRLGQFIAKLRGMAAEFRASFDEMARQSELDELRKEVEAMRRGQFADMATQTGAHEATATVDEIHQSLADVGVQLHPPMSYQYNEMASTPPPAETPVEPAVAPPAPPAAEVSKPARKPRAKAAAAKPAATASTAKASTPRASKATAAKTPSKAVPAKAVPAKAAAKPATGRKPRARKAGAGA